MAPEEPFLVSGVSEWWIYVLNLAPFASILSYTGIHMCVSRSILGLGSRSTKFPNKDPQHGLKLKVLKSNIC